MSVEGSSITLDRLKTILHYDKYTGIWTWLSCRKKHLIGKRADHQRDNKRPYRIVTIDGRKYYSHRLAWFYVTGEWPSQDLDHEDTDKGNNIWLNLRLATDSQNNANKIPVSRTVPKGVDKIRWGFQARIKVNLKSIHLGTFQSAEEAHEAYAQAAEKYFGEFARVK